MTPTPTVDDTQPTDAPPDTSTILSPVIDDDLLPWCGT